MGAHIDGGSGDAARPKGDAQAGTLGDAAIRDADGAAGKGGASGDASARDRGSDADISSPDGGDASTSTQAGAGGTSTSSHPGGATSASTTAQGGSAGSSGLASSGGTGSSSHLGGSTNASTTAHGGNTGNSALAGSGGTSASTTAQGDNTGSSALAGSGGTSATPSGGTAGSSSLAGGSAGGGSTATSASSSIPGMASQYIDAINAVRSEVTEPANYAGTWTPLSNVVWSETVAASAQAWADHLAVALGCDLEHEDQDVYGENLAMGTSLTPAQAVNLWASEKSRYTWSPTYSMADFNAGSGHYTQLVWRQSTQIGCGRAICAQAVVISCRFSPPGNVISQSVY